MLETLLAVVVAWALIGAFAKTAARSKNPGGTTLPGAVDDGASPLASAADSSDQMSAADSAFLKKLGTPVSWDTGTTDEDLTALGIETPLAPARPNGSSN